MMCLLLPVSAFAVDIKWGATFGLNHSFFSGSDWSDEKAEADAIGINLETKLGLGFEIGTFVNIGINNFFSIQPELNILFLRIKHEASFAGVTIVEDTWRIRIAEMPVLARFDVNAGLGNVFFLLGPALQIISGDIELERTTLGGILDANIKGAPDVSVLFAGIVGAGYAIPLGNGELLFELRYRRAFTDFFDHVNWKINTIGLRIGYGVGF